MRILYYGESTIYIFKFRQRIGTIGMYTSSRHGGDQIPLSLDNLCEYSDSEILSNLPENIGATDF